MGPPGPQFDAPALQAATASSPEILRWIEERAPLEIGAWDSIGPEEYGRAFTVAGTAGYDVVGDIYGALVQVIEQGGTEEDFARLITPILQQKGWLPSNGQSIGSRVQLIYDTNLRVARGIGRWQRVQAVAHVMPYLLGQTVGDRRVRDEHRAFHGIVLPTNDPFWSEFWPPMFFRCRCDVIQLTRSQLLRRGLSITPPAEVQTRAALIRPQSWGMNVALAHGAEVQRMVDGANEQRVPGSPPLNAQALEDQGKARWNAIMGLAVSQLVTGLLDAIGISP